MNFYTYARHTINCVVYIFHTTDVIILNALIFFHLPYYHPLCLIYDCIACLITPLCALNFASAADLSILHKCITTATFKF